MTPEEIADRIKRVQQAKWGNLNPREDLSIHEVAEVVLILSQELTALQQEVKALKQKIKS